MRLILLLLFISSAFAQPCGPHEIYVREQWINTYIKQGGIKVSAHTRKSHCRELKRLDYFQDSSKQTFKNIKTNIQKWSPEEKKILEKYLERLPAWLKKYKLTEVLRGDIGGNSINPAAAVPLTKTLLIFDNFFKSSNKQDIINHEISHIAFHNIDPKHSINFAFLSGWKLEKGNHQ